MKRFALRIPWCGIEKLESVDGGKLFINEPLLESVTGGFLGGGFWVVVPGGEICIPPSEFGWSYVIGPAGSWLDCHRHHQPSSPGLTHHHHINRTNTTTTAPHKP
jgi:hypothetical protein